MRSERFPTRLTAVVAAALTLVGVAGGTAPALAAPIAHHAGFDPYSIPIPAMCQHGRSRLHDGAVDWGDDSVGTPLGGATLIQRRATSSSTITDPLYAEQRTRSSAGAVAAVPIACNAGGVGWPETIGLYTRGGRLLASTYLGRFDEKEHASVTSISLTGNAIHARWTAYDGAGFDLVHRAATFTLRHGRLVVSHLRKV